MSSSVEEITESLIKDPDYVIQTLSLFEEMKKIVEEDIKASITTVNDVKILVSSVGFLIGSITLKI